MSRWAIVVVVILACLIPPKAAQADGYPVDWPIPGGQFYTQANGYPLAGSPMGYAIVDDEQARFWSEFERLGGVNRFGYPVSQRFLWGGFISQATQKAILQWRPEKDSVDFVNVFDDLDRAGLNEWLRTVRSVPDPLPPDFDAGLDWAHAVDHRVGLLKTRPALLAFYQSTPDALDQFGLPTSMVVDAGPMYVVRLQRAVLQEWKVKEPWAEVGQVTVANGGDVAKEAGALPWKALRPVAPPPGTWAARANQYHLEGTATWYEWGFVGKAMADGQIYQPTDPLTTASNAFPLGSLLQVTCPLTGKTIRVYVRDTGRFAYPDVVDLSPAAFAALGEPTSEGVIPVSVALVAAPTSPSTTSSTQAPPAP